ncbi:MAG: hypothetical protein HWN67_20215 [Candidatus Helarchaeota archaeon]|nr:hypothetical protein [Candidatus Helarchaeota archaeon]
MSLKSELYRKSIHIFSSIIPLSYAFSSKSFILKILIPLAIFLIMIEIIRFNINFINRIYIKILRDIIRVQEIKRFTGATYLLISSVLVISIYDKSIAVACLLFLTLSDSAAALFGKSFGKIKIYNKTLEGTLAFLSTSLIIVYFIKSLNFITGISGAVTATFVEFTLVNLDDNLSIPIISGLVMQLFNSFLI